MSEAIGCEPCVVSGGVGNTMAQPLDGRSLRFSWPSLTAVNDPDGTRGYFNSNGPDSIVPPCSLVSRFVANETRGEIRHGNSSTQRFISPLRKVSVTFIRFQ